MLPAPLMPSTSTPAQPATAPLALRLDAGSTPDVAGRVRFDQIHSHYRLTPPPVMAGLVFTLLLAWAVSASAGWTLALAWAACKWAVGGVRLAEHWRFERDPRREQRAEYWYWRYYALMLLDGISWGAICWLFLPTGIGPMDAVIVASVIGVAAAAIFTLIGNLFSAASFLATVLLPLFFYYGASAERWGWLGSLGVVIFFGVMLFEAWRGEHLFLELSRLRRENEAIAEQRQRALVLAEQGSAAKSRFLATVSHEVRTPLNGILGMAQLLQETPLAPAQRQRIDVMAQSARHLRTIIDDILDMARIESGRVHLQNAPFTLETTVREVTDVLAPLAADKHLSFHTRIEPQLAARWMGDAARIRQVLHNLLGNAIKFTKRGRVSLEVGAGAGGAGLRFLVIDSGPGIPADALARIFEPFEQAQAASEQRSSGTGLGLSIARQLARAMGGDVRCTASAPTGSSFVFDVACTVVNTARPYAPMTSPMLSPMLSPTPAPMTPPPPSAPARTEAAASAPSLEGTVLVVEDNAVNAMVAGAMLERLGVAFEHVASGEEALLRLREGHFAVVLMDCQMPGLDGMETTRRWRALEAAEPARGHITIVAVTANAGDADRALCLAAGMDDFVAKPFELTVLGNLVARHLAAAVAR
jgi:two-component system, sensor histidine kinase